MSKRSTLAGGGVEALGTNAGEDVRTSGTSSTSGKNDQGEPEPGRYEPVEFESDKEGNLGEVVKESGVVTSESVIAGLHLTSAMAALNLAENALRRANEGTAGMARIASREVKRREYLALNVGEESNKMFKRLALEDEGRGEPGAEREGDGVARSLLNEIGRLRYEVMEGLARERRMKYQAETEERGCLRLDRGVQDDCEGADVPNQAMQHRVCGVLARTVSP